MVRADVKSSISDLERSFGVCARCHHVLPPLEVTGPQYFAEGAVECIACQARVDLQECIRSQVDDNYPPVWVLRSLGAKFTEFAFEVHPGKVAIIDLTKYGVPADAVLLNSSYDSHDVRSIQFRLEWSKCRLDDPKHQAVYCMPVEGEPPEPGKGRAFITWIERGAEAQISMRVADAFRDLVNHDLRGAVVEAFSAFEIALFTFISQYLARTCASEAFRKTIERRLSADSMIKLLQDLCKEMRLRPLSKAVFEALDQLRIRRNTVLHKGSREVITASQTEEGLAAALLGIAFVRYLETHAA